jgi:putative transposase
MPRRARQTPGGLIFHVLNRAVGRMRIFRKDADYAAFEKVLLQAHQRHPIRILAFCLMPNHFHLVVWPHKDGDLSTFMHWLTMTHTQRWRHARDLVGLGPLYQGRFKAFPIEQDHYLLTCLRYVERNPLRAGLVERAQDWVHSSLHVRLANQSPLMPVLHPWPIDLPHNYVDWINRPQTATEEEALRTCIRRNRPFGDPAWQTRMVNRLNLQSSIRPPHRPKKV